jgi:hypothetical protein
VDGRQEDAQRDLVVTIGVETPPSMGARTWATVSIHNVSSSSTYYVGDASDPGISLTLSGPGFLLPPRGAGSLPGTFLKPYTPVQGSLTDYLSWVPSMPLFDQGRAVPAQQSVSEDVAIRPGATRTVPFALDIDATGPLPPPGHALLTADVRLLDASGTFLASMHRAESTDVQEAPGRLPAWRAAVRAVETDWTTMDWIAGHQRSSAGGYDGFDIGVRFWRGAWEFQFVEGHQTAPRFRLRVRYDTTAQEIVDIREYPLDALPSDDEDNASPPSPNERVLFAR